MPNFLVEVEIEYPKGRVEERWRIPVTRKFTLPSDEIVPVKSLKSDEIKALNVGRGVLQKDIEIFFKGYFHGRGLWERIIRMQFVQ